jgi:hypothetical protein
MGLNKPKIVIVKSDDSDSWDVTANVYGVSTSVGKNRLLDRVQPGTAQIMLTNYNREFDPLNTSSPFYGAVIPKASKVYITYERTGVPRARFIFVGYVDDWAFDYSVNGEATASFGASEATALFVRQFITGSSFPAELSGARVNRVLADAGVLYDNIVPYAGSSVDAGTQMLSADTTCAGQNVLEYLNNVAVSEQGAFYYDTTGALFFEDNSKSATNSVNDANRLFTDDGTATAYPYNNIDIGYTSELLYNQIKVLSVDGINVGTFDDAPSQFTYSVSHLDVENIFYSDSTKLANLASFLGTKYAMPEYRINSVTVSFKALDDTQQDNLLAFGRINGFMKVRFLPNNIGTAVVRVVRVIGIEHIIDVNDHQVKYSFESLRSPSLVLDDVEFGKLDTYSLGL